MLDWHSCQICYPLEIKLLLFIIIIIIIIIIITTFLENFKSLNILSKILEINMKCSEILAWGQNFWIQTNFLQGSKV